MFDFIKRLLAKKVHLYHVYAVAESTTVDENGSVRSTNNVNMSYIVGFSRQVNSYKEIFDLVWNNIPVDIVEKIKSQLRQGERFSLTRENISIRSMSYLGRVPVNNNETIRKENGT